MKGHDDYEWEEVLHEGVIWDVDLMICWESTPYRKAITSGPSDRWAPAEGGEVEPTDIAINILYVHTHTNDADGLVQVLPTDQLRNGLIKKFEDEVLDTDAFKDWLADCATAKEEGLKDEAVDRAIDEWKERRHERDD